MGTYRDIQEESLVPAGLSASLEFGRTGRHPWFSGPGNVPLDILGMRALESMVTRGRS